MQGDSDRETKNGKHSKRLLDPNRLMPNRPKKFCNKTGCRNMVISGYCEQHRPKTLRSTVAAVWRKLYDRKWRTYRVYFLIESPLCASCMKAGKVEPATVVDHKTPHRGDIGLFWDPLNHQPLCETCHNRKTATEDGGFQRADERKGLNVQ